MRCTLASTVLACVAISMTARADPSLARYSDDPGNVFWFVVISDTHIGQNWLGGDKDTKRLAWVTGEANAVIQPRHIFNCGDLVDGTKGLLAPCCSQHDEEWTQYRDLVLAAGMTPEFYMDLPGNHDAYWDKGLPHYLEYSISGSADGLTQHAYLDEAIFGNYHFLGVATPTTNGETWPLDPVKLDGAELTYIKLSLEQNASASLHFALGHHPPGFDGWDDFNGMLKSYKVSAYIYGHTHDYLSEFHDGILWFNVRSLGKNGEDHVAVAVVDNDSLAIRAFEVFDWPYVVVSAPSDTKLGGGNPHAYLVPKGWKQAPVRAVVFAKDQVQAVEFQVDKMAWTPMVEVAPHVYQGSMDASLPDESKEHKLRVRAQPWPDKGHEVTFVVGQVACSDGLDNDQDGLTDFPGDKGCEGPADGDETDPAVPPDPGPEETGEDASPDASEAALGEDDWPQTDGLLDPAAGPEQEPADGIEETGAPVDGIEPGVESPSPDPEQDAGHELADEGAVEQTPDDTGPVAAEVAPDPPVEPAPADQTADPADEKTRLPDIDGGCGCRSAGTPGTEWPAWLLLACIGFACGWVSRWKWRTPR